VLVLQETAGLDLNKFSAKVAVLLRQEDALVLRAIGIRALVLGLPVVNALQAEREGGREGGRERGLMSVYGKVWMGSREGGREGGREGSPERQSTSPILDQVLIPQKPRSIRYTQHLP